MSADLGVEVMTIAKEDIVRVLPMVSMLFPNRTVAEWLTGKDRTDDCVESMLNLGPQLVGLKLRDQGCVMGSAGGIYPVPAFDVRAVDDTGAGDSFDAGLILGRRLENGVITSTDYITELNAEMQARIQLDMHRIQLEQARIDYLTAKGLI